MAVHTPTVTPAKWVATQAVRAGRWLLMGLMGPQNSGKTFSALEIATGMVLAMGGDPAERIFVVDTENGRAQELADYFKFKHVDFQPPWTSLRYKDVLQFCIAQGAWVVIIDSGSHEWDEDGGVKDFHEAEVQRLLKAWRTNSVEKVSYAAWAVPKALHSRFKSALTRAKCHVIMCFRCKEGSKQTTKPQPQYRAQQHQVDENENDRPREKTVIEKQGWVPIAAKDLPYEMAFCALLKPHCNGLPTWNPEMPGEREFVKITEPFKGWLNADGQVLNKDLGRRLAEWAKGSASALDYITLGGEKAKLGSAALGEWWAGIPMSKAKQDAAAHKPAWKAIAEEVDAAIAQQQKSETPDPAANIPDAAASASADPLYGIGDGNDDPVT
jgi:hypothetical protein